VGSFRGLLVGLAALGGASRRLRGKNLGRTIDLRFKTQPINRNLRPINLSL
jgi:hypothetical protein